MLDRAELVRRGYVGFLSFEALIEGELTGVPKTPGIYVVLWEQPRPPTFVAVSCGGHFKSKNPTVDLQTLNAKWVQGASVIYIGKADQLQRRLKQYARFGAGHPVGHWGGRYVWQIEGCQHLIVAWQALPDGGDARAEEAKLLQEFVSLYGTRPFANLTG